MGVLVACAGCSTAELAEQKIVETNNRIVAEFQATYCTATECVDTRFACAWPSGAMTRVLNADQLASVRAFIDVTDGTCQR